MTRQETQIMKGVAILMMLILHLFGKTTEDYISALYINGSPIEFILQSAVNPVAFFCILSGYGMHHVFTKGKDANKWIRTRKAYLHWWVSLAIFSILGCVLGKCEYYTDICSVFANYSGYDCTWNYEGWFLLPYILLMLVCPWVFKFTDRFRSAYIALFMVIFGWGLAFVISRYRDVFPWLVHNPLFFVGLLLPAFLLGAILHKEQIVGKIQLRTKNSSWIWAMLLLLVSAVCIISSAATNNVYAFLFTILFLSAPRWHFVDSILTFFGKHSMNIWFTHTWFSNYLFHEEIYQLQYSILIFVVVLLLSLVSSYMLDYICNAINYGTSCFKLLWIKS